MNEVYNFIDKLDIKNKYIVAGISGGPDSMCLLDVLLSLRNKYGYKVVVAHVHHNLRKESDDEALKLEEYCKNNNLIFEMMKIESYPIINKYISKILEREHIFDKTIENDM